MEESKKYLQSILNSLTDRERLLLLAKLEDIIEDNLALEKEYEDRYQEAYGGWGLLMEERDYYAKRAKEAKEAYKAILEKNYLSEIIPKVIDVRTLAGIIRTK